MLSIKKQSDQTPDVEKDLVLLKLINGSPIKDSKENSTRWLDELCQALLGETR